MDIEIRIDEFARPFLMGFEIDPTTAQIMLQMRVADEIPKSNPKTAILSDIYDMFFALGCAFNFTLPNETFQ